jgi:hypothetical protein
VAMAAADHGHEREASVRVPERVGDGATRPAEAGVRADLRAVVATSDPVAFVTRYA